MLSFGELLTIIFVVLILFNIYRIYFRPSLDSTWDDEYSYKRQASRTANPSSEKWQGQNIPPVADYEAADQKIVELKEMLAEKGEVKAPVGTDFSDLTPEERKVRVMSMLNTKRGRTVIVRTQQYKVYEGTITTLTGQQVMIRDKYEGKVVGVNFEDVVNVI